MGSMKRPRRARMVTSNSPRDGQSNSPTLKQDLLVLNSTLFREQEFPRLP